MKISIQWLKDYVDIRISPEMLAHKLTMAGLEVEKIEKVNKDTVFELEITPNRPDCLNMVGIAREISAILNKTLKTPKAKILKMPSKKSDISITDKKGCLRYIGTVIGPMDVKASPQWIQERITALGLRPVNNIVDITNFCLMENGQPLHAFDYDKLIGGKIIVRRAMKGEKIVTIDGVERTLDPAILVIADAQRPVAIAGIMGGLDTEVTEKTKTILLESAAFDQVFTRQAARSLGLSSDSSYRFERGVDIKMVEEGSARAISFIQEYAGGKIQERKDLYPSKKKEAKTQIVVEQGYINDRLGTFFSAAQSTRILKKLGFKVVLKGKNQMKVVPPSFRNDIKERVDIIEEVSRVIGYDNMPYSLPQIKAENIPSNNNRQIKNTLRRALTAQGCSETITYTLINANSLEKSNLNFAEGVRVKNPLTQDQEIMRPSLLPSLLSVVRSNLNRGQRNIRLFELGKAYSAKEEKEVLAVVLFGSRREDWRTMDKEQVDFYDMKGVVSCALEKVQKKEIQYVACDSPVFSKGQGAAILIDKKEIGSFGKVHKDVLKSWDIKQENLFFAQIDLSVILSSLGAAHPFVLLSEYPSVTRDISLAVNESVSFQSLQEIAFDLGSEFLTEVRFLEQYVGPKIFEGHRGLVFSLTYQSSSRTLTEDEVNTVHAKICKALVDKFNAIIR